MWRKARDADSPQYAGELEQVNATYGPLLHPQRAGGDGAAAVSHFALTINRLLFIELGAELRLSLTRAIFRGW